MGFLGLRFGSRGTADDVPIPKAGRHVVTDIIAVEVNDKIFVQGCLIRCRADSLAVACETCRSS